MTLAAITAWARSTWLGRALSAAVVAVVALAATYTAGRRKGRTQAAQQAAEDTLEAVQKRKEIDQTVKEATDADLVDALSRD